MKKGIFTFILLLGLCAAAGSQARNFVYVIRLDDYVINPVVSEYITNAIRKSESDGAQCLVIEMDTPGGLLNTTRTIVKEIMNADIPVVVYVAPSGARAGSAGVFITMASHIAAMAPSTNIGAAHPVDLGEKPEKSKDSDLIKEVVESLRKQYKEEKEVKKEAGKAEEKKEEKAQEKLTPSTTPMEDKILNDTVAWIRGIARERGRNEEWAVDAVVKSISSDEKEAFAKKVVDYLADDVRHLLRQIDGKKVKLPKKEVVLATADAEIQKIPMTRRQSILNVLSNPNIAYILMLLGFYGLLYEITNPGFGVPGIAGLICLVVAFYSLQTLPVNYAALILIILAIILFVAEAKVQSYGLLALAGIISMFLGSLMLIDSPASFMRISLQYILPVVLATAAITVFLVSAVFRAHHKPVMTGVEGLVGGLGTAESDLAPEGKVFVHGEIWNAESSQKIKAGEKVRVVKVVGMKVIVERV